VPILSSFTKIVALMMPSNLPYFSQYSKRENPYFAKKKKSVGFGVKA